MVMEIDTRHIATAHMLNVVVSFSPPASIGLTHGPVFILGDSIRFVLFGFARKYVDKSSIAGVCEKVNL